MPAWDALRTSFAAVASDYAAEVDRLIRRFTIMAATPSVYARSLHLQAGWEHTLATHLAARLDAEPDAARDALVDDAVDGLRPHVGAHREHPFERTHDRHAQSARAHQRCDDDHRQAEHDALGDAGKDHRPGARQFDLEQELQRRGAKGLPQADSAVMRTLISRPANSTPEAAVDHYVKLFKAIGSPSYPTPEDEMRERILLGVQRSFHPEGTLRQMLAIVSDITRAEQLARITCPTLVLHGKSDPLVPYAHGEDTAQRISGSRLLGMEGMGHDLPSEPVAWILDALIPHLQAAEQGLSMDYKSPSLPQLHTWAQQQASQLAKAARTHHDQVDVPALAHPGQGSGQRSVDHIGGHQRVSALGIKK